MKRVSVRFRGTHKRARPGHNYSFIIHDFRLYRELGLNLPEYIVPDKIKENRVIFLDEEIKGKENSYDEFVEVLQELERKQAEDLEKIREMGHKTPSTFKHTFAQVIITFSAEARKEILEGKLSIEDLSEKAKEFFLLFSKVFGVKPLYLALHLDETSPHFHGLTTNLRTYNLNSNPLDDPEVLYIVNSYIPAEKEKIYLGIGKTLTGSIKDTTRFKNPPYYAVDIRTVQDFAGKIFAPIGLFRGLPREERMNRGEPFWKWLHRSVNRLHYDLPMEISLKEKELNEVQKRLDSALSFLKESLTLLKSLQKRKQELEEEVSRLQALLRMKEEEFSKFLEEERRKALQSLEEEIKKKKQELERTREELQKAVKYTTELKSLFKKSYKKLKDSSEELKEKEALLSQLEKQIQQTKKELDFITELKNRSKDEIELYRLSNAIFNNPEDPELFIKISQNPLFSLAETLSTYRKLYLKYKNLPPSKEKTELFNQLQLYQKELQRKLHPYRLLLTQ